MNPREIHIDIYDYPLPDERIARHPLAQRDACRLLAADGTGFSDHIFTELPSLLPEGAMMVCNNTRVINARLRFTKATGALIEIFCLEPHAPADYAQAFATRGICEWQCLIGNSKRWKEGELTMDVNTPAGDTVLRVTRTGAEAAADNSRTVRFEWDNDAVSMADIIAAVGEIPIPPYLNRKSEEADTTDYQTVYSHIDGSVAAPTAGLHFTPELLQRIEAGGVTLREVTLHVGAGTFRPVKSDTLAGHDMHSEFIAVPRAFIEELADAIEQGRKVVAVGTTSVRTLESLYHAGRLMDAGQWDGEVPQWSPYDEDANDMGTPDALRTLATRLRADGDDTFVARTRIIIAPGYSYRVVDAMVTNFHQPQSTLLLLVSAFIGEGWREVYTHALDAGYRFLSYGDACYFTRRDADGELRLIEKVRSKVLAGEDVDDTDFYALADTATDAGHEALLAAAEEVTRRFCTRKFDSCSIVNARSGRCSENCKWCAQSAHYHTGCDTYDIIDADEAVATAAHNHAGGIGRFSMVASGRAVKGKALDDICAILRRAGEETGIATCASLGLLSYDDLVKLREAGAVRYHCNLETAPSHFGTLCTTHTIDDKLRTIDAAHRAGLDVCSGGIIGMGETPRQRVEFALTLRKAQPVSIPVNILCPIAGTPLADTPLISEKEIERTVAIFRLIHPSAELRFAGGRARLSRECLLRCMHAGINGAITGDLLTTTGSTIASDRELVEEAGYQF